MNIFKDINQASEKLSDASQTYVKKSQEYYKLKIFQQLCESVSYVTKILIIGGLLFITLFFLAFAFAMFIGEIIGNTALGYVITALIMLAITAIVYFNRHYISNSVVRRLSTKFFE